MRFSFIYLFYWNHFPSNLHWLCVLCGYFSIRLCIYICKYACGWDYIGVKQWFNCYCAISLAYSQTFRLTAEGLEAMATFIGQGLPMTCQTTNHSSFRSASRFGAWKCHHNNSVNSRMYFKDSMPQTLNISHTFENPAFSWSWQALVVTVVNSTAFFFREGVWHHGIFVSRQNVKECDTQVSRKSCIIQSIRWRLRNSWSVSS